MNGTSVKRTVGFQPHVWAREINRESWRDVLQWIHYQMGAAEIDGLLSELYRRFAQQPQTAMPIEAIENETRVAAAYLLLAPGKVASLGGVRAMPGFTRSGFQLVNHLTQRAIESGAQQIQAIVDSASDDVANMLLPAGFRHLAILKHLWLQLADRPSVGQLHTAPDVLLVPAHQFARKRMEQLLAHTFDGTLDCPALNGLRNPASILDSFLDGRNLRSHLPWWIVQANDEEVGCLLLSHHSHGVCELAYMGLLPAARNRGIGAVLLHRACEKAVGLGSSILVAAVDCENWPAVRLYDQAGFHEHRRLQAWFRV